MTEENMYELSTYFTAASIPSPVIYSVFEIW